jgi:hypothetical protein
VTHHQPDETPPPVPENDDAYDKAQQDKLDVMSVPEWEALMSNLRLRNGAIRLIHDVMSALRTRGWAAGVNTWAGDGPVCVVVAMVHLSPDRYLESSPVLDEATRRLWLAVGGRPDAFPDRMWAGAARLALIGWNDEPGRTEGEVIHALEAATAEAL